MFLERIAKYATQLETKLLPAPTAIPELLVLNTAVPTKFEGALYNPIVCLTLQGEKLIHIGDKAITLCAGDTMIISQDMPVMASVTKASIKEPYIALVLVLDFQLLHSIYEDMKDQNFVDQNSLAAESNKADVELTDAFRKLFFLLDKPQDIKVMAPILLRELHYRLLQAKNGKMLHQLLKKDSSASRIAKAIAKIKEDLTANISINELANIAGMSPSSFHEHFKAVTAKSPLQYQKEYRLLHARMMIHEGRQSISQTAFKVGYESPNQFSREYSRKFGHSPRQDQLQFKQNNL